MPILSAQECEYRLAILKTNLSESQLGEFYASALTTCEVLFANLVKSVEIQRIWMSYYRDVSQPTVTKLLMRALQLYQVRHQAHQILKTVCELESLFTGETPLTRMLQHRAENSEKQRQVAGQYQLLIRKAVKALAEFKKDHHLFKRQFLYRGRDI